MSSPPGDFGVDRGRLTNNQVGHLELEAGSSNVAPGDRGNQGWWTSWGMLNRIGWQSLASTHVEKVFFRQSMSDPQRVLLRSQSGPLAAFLLPNLANFLQRTGVPSLVVETSLAPLPLSSRTAQGAQGQGCWGVGDSYSNAECTEKQQPGFLSTSQSGPPSI